MFPSKMYIFEPYHHCDGVWRWNLWELLRLRLGHRMLPSWLDVVSVKRKRDFLSPHGRQRKTICAYSVKTVV